MNPYEELGVPKDATEAEIRKAYRQRAADTHPDHHPDKIEEFKSAKRALDILLDSERREQFDRNGTTNDPQQGKAMGLVAHAFRTALTGALKHDVRKTDIVSAAQTIIEKELAGCREKVEELTLQREKLEEVQKRIKGKRAHRDNLLRSMIAEPLRETAENLQNARDGITACEEALEILWPYWYKLDEVERQTMTFVLRGTGTTSTTSC